MIGRRGIAPARMLGPHVRAAKARRIAARAVYGDPGEMRARRRAAVAQRRGHAVPAPHPSS